MKIFLIIFSSIALSFVGKSALAHTHSNLVKSKFSQSLTSKTSYLNAIEEEEISEDLHEEKEVASSTLPRKIDSFEFNSSEDTIQIHLSDKFAMIKSHFLALFKQQGKYRI